MNLSYSYVTDLLAKKGASFDVRWILVVTHINPLQAKCRLCILYMQYSWCSKHVYSCCTRHANQFVFVA